MRNQVMNQQERAQNLLKLRNMISEVLEVMIHANFIDDELAEKLIEVMVKVDQAYNEALGEYPNE